MLSKTGVSSITVCILLLALRSVPTCGQTTGEIRPIGDNNGNVCEEMTVNYCKDIRSETTVYLPNPRGHDNQTKALAEFDDFLPLITANVSCSNGLYHFLCSYYFPLCYNNSLENNKPTKLKPCRSLCEYVRPPCEEVLLANNVSWPIFLNCSLDDFADGSTCFGPPDPSTALFTTVHVPNQSTTSAFPAGGTSDAIKNLSSLLFIVFGLVLAWSASKP